MDAGFGVALSAWDTSTLLAMAVLAVGSGPIDLPGELGSPETIAKWTVAGVVGGPIVGWLALGPSIADGADLGIVLVRSAVVGGVGGAFVGANAARIENDRRNGQRERDRWQALFARAPAAIADLSVEAGDAIVVTANDAFADWFPDESPAAGREFEEIVAVDGAEADVPAAVRAGRTITTDLSRETGDERRHYRLRIVPYEYGDGERRAFAILTDGTNLREMERKLQRTVTELSDKNERLEQFATVVSHDLRNPLSVAMGNLELVDAPDDEDRIETATDALDRIDDIISDLLELARDGRSVDDPVAVNPGSVARSSWRTVETAEMDLVVDVDTTVLADENRLRQLFENLFRNARLHAGDDVTVTVGETTDESGFFVADDGPGIPEDERDVVFEAGRTSASSGTGLGLNIVREIAEGHGWAVELTESADGGARFEFRDVESP